MHVAAGAWARVPSPEPVVFQFSCSRCGPLFVIFSDRLVWTLDLHLPWWLGSWSEDAVVWSCWCGEDVRKMVLFPGDGGSHSFVVAGYSYRGVEVSIASPSSAQVPGKWRLPQLLVAGFRFLVVVILVWGSLLDRVGLGWGASSDVVKRSPGRRSSRWVMMLSDGLIVFGRTEMVSEEALRFRSSDESKLWWGYSGGVSRRRRLSRGGCDACRADGWDASTCSAVGLLDVWVESSVHRSSFLGLWPV